MLAWARRTHQQVQAHFAGVIWGTFMVYCLMTARALAILRNSSSDREIFSPGLTWASSTTGATGPRTFRGPPAICWRKGSFETLVPDTGNSSGSVLQECGLPGC